VSFLFGRPERRSVNFVSPPIPPNSQAGTFGSTYARVDLAQTEASLQKIAVWACVNLTATIAETMPLDVYAGPGKERTMPSWMADLGGDGHGLGDWLYQYIFSAMLRGNDYGLVAGRDSRMGTPTQIVLQHPDDVRLRMDADGMPEWRVNGQVLDDRSKMWHRRVHPAPGRILGLSPIALQATTIGTGIAAMRFGAQGIGLLRTGCNLSASLVRPGDHILLSGTLGDHGITILSQREGLELSGELQSDAAPLHILTAAVTNAAPNVRCMRDLTRGGLSSALNEVAQSSRTGVELDEEQIPVRDSVRGACELFGLDPLYVANEGKLIAIVPEAEVDAALLAMQANENGHDAREIGGGAGSAAAPGSRR